MLCALCVYALVVLCVFVCVVLVLGLMCLCICVVLLFLIVFFVLWYLSMGCAWRVFFLLGFVDVCVSCRFVFGVRCCC